MALDGYLQAFKFDIKLFNFQLFTRIKLQNKNKAGTLFEVQNVHICNMF